MTLTATKPVRLRFGDSRFSRWADRHRRLVLITPALIFVVAMIGIPLGWTVWLSLTDAEGSVRTPYDFIGLGNYISVFTDTERFWPAAIRTAVFTTAALVLELTFGMMIALLLRRPFKAQGPVRVAILLPFVATPVAIAMMWRLILDPNIGAANQLLGLVGIPPQPWLSGTVTAMPTLILIDVWQFTPMITIILLAGLTALPDEPDEASRIDGANAWQRFWYVTLPLMRPVIVVAAILRCIDAFKTFDLLYVAKGEGGGSFHEAETLNIYAYGLSFRYYEFGLASTVLIVFFFLIVITMLLINLARKPRRP